MKYKVNQGTELFKELSGLKKKIDRVRSDALRVAKSYGASELAGDPHALAGGIGGIKFDKKPEGWRSVGESWQHLYYPKVANKQDNKIVGGLEIVSYEELNKILGYDPQSYCDNGGFVFSRCPGVTWDKKYILVEVSEKATYKPHKDLIEITVSEFNKLKK